MGNLIGKNLVQVSRKDKPWNTHKRENFQIGRLYGEDDRFMRYSERMAECADWLEFSEVEGHDQKLKLTRAYFCHVRHCPICQWRKSLARIARFMKNMPTFLEEFPNFGYLYVVLTTRNCEMGELRETIREQNNGVKKLLKRLDRAGVKVHGYIRTNEVTKGRDGNPHPHENLILAVNKSYFKSASYLSKMRWVGLWRDVMGLDYDPSVFVSRVRRRRKKDAGKGEATEGEDLTSGILEVSKYAVKPADMTDDKEFLYGITEQCHGLRFLSTGGCFKNIFRDGDKNEDEIDDDDMMLKSEENDKIGNGIKQIYLWYRKKGYILKARQKFSEDREKAYSEFLELMSHLMRDKRQNE